MSGKTSYVSKFASFFSMAALIIGVAAPALLQDTANAAQVTSRSIQMSRSTPGATGVSYKVTFTAPTAGQSLVIDFCGASPIIGQACALPTGMVLTSAASPTGQSGWTITAPTIATSTTVKVSRSAAWTAGNTLTFEIEGITNPTVTAPTSSFYGRITTYANATQGTYTGPSSPNTPGNYVDYGGIALSTASDINISATVMETLQFCVSKAAPTAGCGGTTSPNLILGKGLPKALDTAAVTDTSVTDTAYTQLSTNASNGAIVNLKTVSSTTCAGLSRDGGATCEIAAKTTYGQILVNAGEFGLNVAPSGTTPNVNYASGYGGTPHSYRLNQTNAISPYGDTIMTVDGPVANANNLLTYAANAKPTTAAGVYTTAQSLIATGTF